MMMFSTEGLERAPDGLSTLPKVVLPACACALRDANHAAFASPESGTDSAAGYLCRAIQPVQGAYLHGPASRAGSFARREGG